MPSAAVVAAAIVDDRDRVFMDTVVVAGAAARGGVGAADVDDIVSCNKSD